MKSHSGSLDQIGTTPSDRKQSFAGSRELAQMRLWLLLLFLFSCPASTFAAGPLDAPTPVPQKVLPLDGEVFTVAGRVAFLIPARNNSSGRAKPWVWYAPTLPGLPGKEEKWMFEQFLDAGIAIAGMDVGESFGSPAGRKLFTAFHTAMSESQGYSSKPVLLGRSRGGLMTLSWAAENPDKVAAFAGIYPVCNVASYPGVAKAAPAYEMTPDELQTHLAEHNPIDRLTRLAQAKVPFFAIHGDQDVVVPLDKNSGLLRERYLAMGGSVQLIVPPGQGHNMWSGFFQCQELVDFVVAHVGPTIVLSSPKNYQVVQRSSKTKGSITLRGSCENVEVAKLTIEARLVVARHPGRWRRLPIQVHDGKRSFEVRWDAPAGGWHRIEVRVLRGSDIIATSVVEHVGVGEVFVIAGQSNSANHGEEKQNTHTGLVTAFDGERWQLARDPQPGASGSEGSFMPPLGDALAATFHVPIGFIACGVGATSVREWLPKGERFPNPPTLTNHIQQLVTGGWESKGAIYQSFTTRMKSLGRRGFRAVLWHQGESDAHQADATRTLSGTLYREYLEKLIRVSRREVGWEAPWFVAQASYHVPGDEGSSDIRAAQASLWKDGIALEGPDTDAIKGEFRDSGGRGVHFSGPGLREHANRWVKRVTPWLEKSVR